MYKPSTVWCVVAVAAALLFCMPLADAAAKNTYHSHNQVPLVVNNVGPFNNPAESYKYYDLPFCAPAEAHNAPTKFGEHIAGDRRRSSLYDIRYRVDVQWRSLCTFPLEPNDIKKFIDAIKEHYVFEMFIDDLPIKGFVGETETSKQTFGDHEHDVTRYYLFTHLDFNIAWNGANIVSTNLTTDPDQRVELRYDTPTDVEFSYSVRWVHTPIKWENRVAHHSKSAISDQAVDIHWLSIVNSVVLVILLTTFLSILLMRVLKKDFARYMDVDEEDLEEDVEEVGWKLVHGDVFRFPANVMLLSALIGTGTQLFLLVCMITLLALFGMFYPGNRGAVYTAVVFVYAATACVAGYVSTKLYVQLGGQRWAWNSILTGSVFAFPLFAVFAVNNTIAVSYGSSSALQGGIIFIIILLWALVTFPLTVLGSMRGKHAATISKLETPCKTNRVEREVPPVDCLRSTWVQALLAGFLPFSAIYIELHYIFASVWGHRVYTLFGILALTFVLLIIVVAFISVALTYFQLAVENYHWWWRSFVSGASTGLFVYAYAFFFFWYRSEMSGVLQSFFFFGYMAVISYAFALMLGAVSFWMSKRFVWMIYGSIKVD